MEKLCKYQGEVLKTIINKFHSLYDNIIVVDHDKNDNFKFIKKNYLIKKI
jgi:hypothetical protein